MSHETSKLRVVAILALTQSLFGPKLKAARVTYNPSEDYEHEQRAQRQLALAEQRQQQKKARRALQFNK